MKKLTRQEVAAKWLEEAVSLAEFGKWDGIQCERTAKQMLRELDDAHSYRMGVDISTDRDYTAEVHGHVDKASSALVIHKIKKFKAAKKGKHGKA